jgi:hypothetical protein
MLNRGTVVAAVVLMVFLFLFFAMIAFSTSSHFEREMGVAGTAAKMEFAFTWTVRAIASVIAVLAVILLIVIAGQGQPVNRIVPASVALLGALLLLGQHWSVAIAFGVLALGVIVREIVLLRGRPPESPAPPASGPAGPPATGIQATAR